MASVTPDLQLPSRPQSITALWRVPNYTAGWQRHMGVNNLPRVVAWRCTGRESNPGPLDHQSDTLTTTPASHPVGRLSLPILATSSFRNKNALKHGIFSWKFTKIFSREGTFPDPPVVGRGQPLSTLSTLTAHSSQLALGIKLMDVKDLEK